MPAQDIAGHLTLTHVDACAVMVCKAGGAGPARTYRTMELMQSVELHLYAVKTPGLRGFRAQQVHVGVCGARLNLILNRNCVVLLRRLSWCARAAGCRSGINPNILDPEHVLKAPNLECQSGRLPERSDVRQRRWRGRPPSSTATLSRMRSRCAALLDAALLPWVQQQSLACNAYQPPEVP